MASHDDIKRIAARVFEGHGMEAAPARSWRLGKPKTSAYAFRVTWAPGMIALSGDVGTVVYEVWPAFATLGGAIDLVNEAHFDYLAGKSGVAKVFDREATVADLVRYAYEDKRQGGRGRLFAWLCDEYGGDPNLLADRKAAVRAFRDDDCLSAERIYGITGDAEDLRYSLPSDARWAYEAVKLWAAMLRQSADALNIAGAA